MGRSSSRENDSRDERSGDEAGECDSDLEEMSDGLFEDELTRLIGSHISPTQHVEIVNLAGRQQPHLPLLPQNAQPALSEHYQSSPFASSLGDQGAAVPFLEAHGRSPHNVYLPDIQYGTPSSMAYTGSISSQQASGLRLTPRMLQSLDERLQYSESNPANSQSVTSPGSWSNLSSRSVPHLCLECKKSFPDAKQLQRHDTKCHTDKWPCNLCGKPLKWRKDNYIRHLKSCKGYDRWRGLVGAEILFQDNTQGHLPFLSGSHQQQTAAGLSQPQSGFCNGPVSPLPAQHLADNRGAARPMSQVSPDPVLPTHSYRGPGLARQGWIPPPGYQHNMPHGNPWAPSVGPAGAAAAQNAQRILQQSLRPNPPPQPTSPGLDQSYGMYGSQLPPGVQYNASQQFDPVGSTSRANPAVEPSRDHELYGNRAAPSGSIYDQRPIIRRAPAQLRYRKAEMPPADEEGEETGDDDDDDETQ